MTPADTTPDAPKTSPGPTPGGTPAPSHPGMMGDGTEEQNLDQPGDPKARITEDEVQEAFKDKGSGTAPKP